MKYVYVIERANDGSYSAYVPDLPGCTTSGETVDEVKRNIKDAVRSYIDSLREHSEPVTAPFNRGRDRGGVNNASRRRGPRRLRERHGAQRHLLQVPELREQHGLQLISGKPPLAAGRPNGASGCFALTSLCA